MATQPTTSPGWATDTNYASGPDNGTPTKVDPGAGIRAQGFIPEDQVAAQHWNHHQNLIGQWLEWLEQERVGSRVRNWTSLSSSTSGLPNANGRCLAHRPGTDATQWVMGLSSGNSYNSTNGHVWAVSSSEPANIGAPFHGRSLIWSSVASLWIMSTGNNGSSPGGVMTSADASTWVARTTHDATTFNHYGIAENSTTIVVCGNSPHFYSSTNGTTWTLRTNPTANGMHGIAWSSTLSLFCAVGAGGTILTSPDGTTWTSRTSGTAFDLWDVIWEPVSARFIAASKTNGTVRVSTDGITWSGGGTPPDYRNNGIRVSSLVHGGDGLILACGTSSNLLASLAASRDGGATWQNVRFTTSHSVGAPSLPEDVSVHQFDGRFQLVGSNGSNPANGAGIAFTGPQEF